MACNNPLTITVRGVPYQVPCRNCMSCRVTSRNYWQLRCRLEAYQYYRRGLGSTFVTLTYDDSHLPLDKRGKPNLCKSDVQNFLKRLRSDYQYHNGKKLDFKYLIVGELGSQTLRSHYHAIFFGLPLGAIPNMRKLWNKGMISIQPLTTGRIRYALKYMDKQIPFKEHKRLLSEYGFESPFVLRSKSIGCSYYLSHFFELQRDNGVKSNGHIVPLPVYYRKKYGFDDFDPSMVNFFKNSRALRENKTIQQLDYDDFRGRELTLLKQCRDSGHAAPTNLEYEFNRPPVNVKKLANLALED